MAYLRLFIIFAKIGFFTIGGGLAMVPLVQQELVNSGYMTIRETIDMVSVSQMTPGPFAVNTATFAGMRLGGVLGAACSTLGVALPSIVICLFVARYFFKYLDAKPVRAVLSGIRPVVFALILHGMLTICGVSMFPALAGDSGASGLLSALTHPDWAVIALAVAASVAMQKWKVNPIILVIACGAIGAVLLHN